MKTSSKIAIVAAAVGAWLIAKKKGVISGIGATHSEITGKVLLVEYRNTSYYGNNSYWVTIETDGGRYLRAYTSPNSQLGYLIKSLEGRTVTFDVTYTKNGGVKLNHTIGKYFPWEH